MLIPWASVFEISLRFDLFSSAVLGWKWIYSGGPPWLSALESIHYYFDIFSSFPFLLDSLSRTAISKLFFLLFNFLHFINYSLQLILFCIGFRYTAESAFSFLNCLTLLFIKQIFEPFFLVLIGTLAASFWEAVKFPSWISLLTGSLHLPGI